MIKLSPTIASNMRDFGTAPLAMDAMAVEKKVMAQVGNKGEEVVNPNKRSSTKFCKSNIYGKRSLKLIRDLKDEEGVL